jgi:hypothetical protein
MSFQEILIQKQTANRYGNGAEIQMQIHPKKTYLMTLNIRQIIIALLFIQKRS